MNKIFYVYVLIGILLSSFLLFPIVNAQRANQEKEIEIIKPVLEGQDFTQRENRDGSFTIQIGIPLRVKNNDNDLWVPYIYEDKESYHLLRAGQISIRIIKSSGFAQIYDSDNKDLRVDLEIFDVLINNVSTNIINASFGIRVRQYDDYGSIVIAKRNNLVMLQVEYRISNGVLKKIITIENLNSKSTSYELVQTHLGIQANIVEKIISSDIRAKEDIFIYKNDRKMILVEQQNIPEFNHANISRIKGLPDSLRADYFFNIPTLNIFEQYIIDPETFTNAAPTLDTSIITDRIISVACSPTIDSKQNSTTILTDVQDADINARCYRGLFQWDITPIPDNAIVINTVFQYDVTVVTSMSDRDVEIRAITNESSISSATTLWNDIGNGTVYVTVIGEIVSNNISQDLGSSADTDIQTQLSSNWFAIGTILTNETRDSSSSHGIRINDQSGISPTPPPTLIVTYNLPTTIVLLETVIVAFFPLGPLLNIFFIVGGFLLVFNAKGRLEFQASGMFFFLASLLFIISPIYAIIDSDSLLYYQILNYPDGIRNNFVLINFAFIGLGLTSVIINNKGRLGFRN